MRPSRASGWALKLQSGPGGAARISPTWNLPRALSGEEVDWQLDGGLLGGGGCGWCCRRRWRSSGPDRCGPPPRSKVRARCLRCGRPARRAAPCRRASARATGPRLIVHPAELAGGGHPREARGVARVGHQQAKLGKQSAGATPRPARSGPSRAAPSSNWLPSWPLISAPASLLSKLVSASVCLARSMSISGEVSPPPPPCPPGAAGRVQLQLGQLVALRLGIKVSLNCRASGTGARVGFRLQLHRHAQWTATRAPRGPGAPQLVSHHRAKADARLFVSSTPASSSSARCAVRLARRFARVTLCDLPIALARLVAFQRQLPGTSIVTRSTSSLRCSSGGGSFTRSGHS